MRSEEEIKIALKIALEAYMTAEQEIILIDAITELLALRRRLEDRKALAKFLFGGNWGDIGPEVRGLYLRRAEELSRYLTEGKDGE